MRRDHRIKFTDKLKANLWMHLDLAKVYHWKRLCFLFCFVVFVSLKKNKKEVLESWSSHIHNQYEIIHLLSICHESSIKWSCIDGRIDFNLQRRPTPFFV